MQTPLPAPVPPSPAAATPPPADGASVPAGHGLDWWTSGWRLFTAAPGAWLAITVVYIAIMFALSLVPLLGQFAVSLIHPVLAGGIVLGCREQDRGGTLRVAHLFAGFSEKLGPLVILALLYFAGWLVIGFVAVGLVMTLIGGGALAAIASGDAMQAGYVLLSMMSMGALVVLLVCALLVVPLLMAFWFAPPLIMLRGDEPVAAMLTSFRACLRNMLPFTVYGLIGIVFIVIASLPLFLGLLVLIPVAAATVYTSYKDVFEAGPASGVES
jgi:uncharacterized membrane protein